MQFLRILCIFLPLWMTLGTGDVHSSLVRDVKLLKTYADTAVLYLGM